MNKQLTPLEIWENNKEIIPFWYSDLKPFISGNGVQVKNQVIATLHKDHDTCFVTTESLWEIFNGYGNSEEGFSLFIGNYSCYRAPNSRMMKFQYDPCSGEYIRWDEIKKLYANHIVKVK